MCLLREINLVKEVFLCTARFYLCHFLRPNRVKPLTSGSRVGFDTLVLVQKRELRRFTSVTVSVRLSKSSSYDVPIHHIFQRKY